MEEAGEFGKICVEGGLEMTTRKEDVVFVMHGGLEGPIADGWNVVEGKVLLGNEAEGLLKRRRVKYERMVVGGYLVLAVGVEGVLKGLYRGKGKLVQSTDGGWGELFNEGGERKGYGEHVEGEWSWGGVDIGEK